jgi:hypothetical protein
LAAFDDANDGHARAELAGLRCHAHGAYVSGLESLQDVRWRDRHGARAKIFKLQAGVLCVTLFDGGGDAGGDRSTSFVGD